MTRGRDGEKFGYSFNDGDDDGLDQGHLVSLEIRSAQKYNLLVVAAFFLTTLGTLGHNGSHNSNI